LIFGGIGVVVFVLMVKEVIRDRAMQQWPKVACTIQHTKIEPKQDGYAFEVSYRYKADGKTHVNTTYRTDYRESDHYADAEKLARRFPASSQQQCFVNPSNPDEAVLEVQSPAKMSAFLPLPLVFILIGGVFFYSVWFRRDRSSITAPSPTGPISERAVNSTGARIGILVFGIFFIVGASIMVFWTIPIERKMLASSHWRATRCKILSSRVRSHDSDDGTTYSVDILYTYKVNGASYTSDCYSFVGGSSSGSAGKVTVVQQYRTNRPATCYVNPDNPAEAVLKPGWSAEGLLPLIPAVFLLVGAGGLIGIYKYRRRKRSGENIWAIKRPGVETSIAAPHMMPIQKSITLKPAQTARVRFFGLLIFAIVWNGFIAIAYFVWRNSGSQLDICTGLFMTPFVAVGIGVVIGVIYSLLALMNPSAEIEVTPGQLTLGTQASVRWLINGRANRITKLTIRVEAREEATYQRGTRTTTDKNVFQIIAVTETSSPMQIARGEAKFQIAANTMHSFNAPHNKIIWSIKLAGEIPNWPDLMTEYALEVQPTEARS
jgi:hypothetical protein